VDNPTGNTKSVDDMVFDEVNNIARFNFAEWYSFRPHGEVISYCEDEPMTSSRWRTDGSNNIDSPGFKWP